MVKLHCCKPVCRLLRNVIPEGIVSLHIGTDSRFNTSDISLLELAEPAVDAQGTQVCMACSMSRCKLRRTIVECFEAWAPSPGPALHMLRRDRTFLLFAATAKSTILACCSVTEMCASCASFCTSGAGKSLLAEQILLVRCRHRLDVEGDKFKRKLVVLRSRQAAEECMLRERWWAEGLA